MQRDAEFGRLECRTRQEERRTRHGVGSFTAPTQARRVVSCLVRFPTRLLLSCALFCNTCCILIHQTPGSIPRSLEQASLLARAIPCSCQGGEPSFFLATAPQTLTMAGVS